MSDVVYIVNLKSVRKLSQAAKYRSLLTDNPQSKYAIVRSMSSMLDILATASGEKEESVCICDFI